MVAPEAKPDGRCAPAHDTVDAVNDAVDTPPSTANDVPLPVIGIGTDVHRWSPGRPCWVAGLHWPDEPAGLGGHSDADVVAHAACDALLSAAGLGDLGSQVGTADPAWADASGTALLTETARRVRSEGYAIGNVAIQLIGPVRGWALAAKRRSRCCPQRAVRG
jgi:hypothetical protein